MFCFCAESRRVARLLTARYDQHLAPAGLTSAQFEVLSILNAKQQMNGRDLSNALAVDPTTMSRNLKALSAAKRISAARSREDARQTLYSLTAKGDAVLQKANHLWFQAHRETMHALGKGGGSAQAALSNMTDALRG